MGKNFTIHDKNLGKIDVYYLDRDATREAALLLNQSVLGFDVETTHAEGYEDDLSAGLDPYRSRLRLLQFSIKTPTGYSTYLFDNFKITEETRQILILVLEACSVKAGYNTKFDIKMTKHHLGVRRFGKVFCGEIGYRLTQCGQTTWRQNLETIVLEILGFTLEKELQMSDWSGDLTQNQLEYAAIDSVVVLPVREKLIELITQLGITYPAKLDFDTLDPIASAELTGFYLNEEKWIKVDEQMKERRLTVMEQLIEFFREQGAIRQQGLFVGAPAGSKKCSSTISSPKQVAYYLEACGIELPLMKDKKTRETKKTTNSVWLKPLKNANKVIELLLEFRELDKRKSSYGAKYCDKYIHPITLQIHSDYDAQGTKTARFSNSKPNLQQIPQLPEYRSCFEAYPENYVLVGADFCLAEGTAVFTDKGILPIEEVRVGDYAVQPDGTFKRIIKAAYSGIKDCLLLETQDGNRIVPTPEHRFRTFDSTNGYDWSKTKKINKQRVHLFSNTSLNLTKDVLLPLPAKGHYREHPHITAKLLTKDFGELLGYMIGDGSFQHKNVSFVVNQQDRDVYDLMLDKAKRHFGLEKYTEYKYRGVYEAKFNSTLISRWLTQLGVGNGEFNVPLFTENTEALCAILRGYFEADGSVSTSEFGRVSCASSKEQCTRTVQLLLNFLGIHSRVRVQNNIGPDKNKTAYVLTILSRDTKTFQQRIGFISKRKKEKLEQLINTLQKGRNKRNRGITFLKSAGLSNNSKVNTLLANARNLGRTISPELAAKIIQLDPVYAEKLQLHLVAQGTFQKATKTKLVPQHTFDLQVEDTNTFIANGFVVHNSQIELRIAAELSGDAGYISAFLSGADFHAATAEFMFGVKKGDPDYEKMRYYAKRINFGIIYGMGAGKLALQTGLPESKETLRLELLEKYGIIESASKWMNARILEGYSRWNALKLAKVLSNSQIENEVYSTDDTAQDYLNKYYETFETLMTWLNDRGEEAAKYCQIRMKSGRLVKFWVNRKEPWSVAQAERNGMNTPIQGLAGEILKIAIRLVYDRIYEENLDHVIKIVHTVHDELIVKCPEEYGKIAKQILEEEMIKAGQVFLKKVPVKVDAHIGKEWSK